MQNNVLSDTVVSSQLKLLQGTDSTVERGNLLTLPLAGGLLYVQPVFVRGTGRGSYPLLRKVVVAFGDKIGFADTLDDALDQVFGDTGTTPPKNPETGTGGNADVQAALADAQQALTDSAAALKAGDFAAYGAAQKRLQAAIQAAVDAQGRAGTSKTSKSSKKTSKSTPTPSPSG